jgi:hypothetical protein
VLKRMYKVISPIERRDGGKFWMRCGNAFTNKDESINVHLDVLPLFIKEGGVTLQLRELTEEELRERAEKRASFAASRGVHQGAAPAATSSATPF